MRQGWTLVCNSNQQFMTVIRTLSLRAIRAGHLPVLADDRSILILGPGLCIISAAALAEIWQSRSIGIQLPLPG
jgi:hypothetical protein